MHIFNFMTYYLLFPSWLYPFIFRPAMCDGASFFTSCQYLTLFDFWIFINLRGVKWSLIFVLSSILLILVELRFLFSIVQLPCEYPPLWTIKSYFSYTYDMEIETLFLLLSLFFSIFVFLSLVCFPFKRIWLHFILIFPAQFLCLLIRGSTQSHLSWLLIFLDLLLHFIGVSSFPAFKGLNEFSPLYFRFSCLIFSGISYLL